MLEGLARGGKVLAAIVALIAVTRPCAAEASAPVVSREDKSAQALEQLARVNFGELSGAEKTLVRGAVHREPGWAGVGDDPDNPRMTRATALVGDLRDRFARMFLNGCAAIPRQFGTWNP